MNKNRTRTQRRMRAREAASNRFDSGKRIKLPKSVIKSMQRGVADRTPVELDTPFEIQRRDASGRWRKAPGVPRVHAFGLARLRARKITPQGRSEAVRVRNVTTGDTWSL